MAILVCRVAWMPGYRSDEEQAIGGGGYVVAGNVPHESRNFLPIGDTYYGFVENRGHRIGLENLGGQRADGEIAGVSVVFCAEHPIRRELLVTGWYSDATVHRDPFNRPEADPVGRRVYFEATEATLIGEAERCFPIPRARDKPRSPFGGIGRRFIWYGLNERRAATFRKSLIEYMATQTLVQQTPEEVVVESRKRRLSERLERKGTYRHFIQKKGYRCEACEWTIEEDEVDVWGSSFELHHLAPVHDIEEGTERKVGIKDFAVLCASCHRAIHRTGHVSDVKRFAQDYIGN